MANRNDPDPANRSNDPVTAPEEGAARPRRSEVDTSGGRTEEAAARARATESGRGAAKWIGIILAAIVALFILAAIFGGGAWIWGPAPGEEVETVE